MEVFQVSKTYRFKMDFLVKAKSKEDAISLVDDVDMCSPSISIDDTGIEDFNCESASIVSHKFPYFADHETTEAEEWWKDES